MRVDNQDINSIGGGNTFAPVSPAGSHSKSSNKAADEDASSDVVKLSNASSLIQLARKVASADRQSRIHQLTSQVQSGTYQVNSQDVSQAIIKHSR